MKLPHHFPHKTKEQLKADRTQFEELMLQFSSVKSTSELQSYVSNQSEANNEEIKNIHAAFWCINHMHYGLDVYTNRFNKINSQDMLFNYAYVGLTPDFLTWEKGQSLLQSMKSYQAGQMGLAYEIVTNDDPCTSYLMSDNTMAMQALVIAHAGFGHNSFFKNNYMFKEWTKADLIKKQCLAARELYYEACKVYGEAYISIFLDACETVMHFGINKADVAVELKRELEDFEKMSRDEFDRIHVDPIAPSFSSEKTNKSKKTQKNVAVSKDITLPTDRVLYFLEKVSPFLQQHPLLKEMVRHTRIRNMYFYPQRQTQVMNEGWASFWHHTMLHDAYDLGFIDEGATSSLLRSHQGVLFQPGYTAPYFNGFNPYAIGFHVFTDAVRAVNMIKGYIPAETGAEKELLEEYQEFYGPILERLDEVNNAEPGKEWLAFITYIMENYKDDTFLINFLSPQVIRYFKLFEIEDSPVHPEYYLVTAVEQNCDGDHIREALCNMYDIANKTIPLTITNANLNSDRSLEVAHFVYPTSEEMKAYNNMSYESPEDTNLFKKLYSKETGKVVRQIHQLWAGIGKHQMPLKTVMNEYVHLEDGVYMYADGTPLTTEKDFDDLLKKYPDDDIDDLIEQGILKEGKTTIDYLRDTWEVSGKKK